jgi:type I restriction enzyme S subunit
MISQHLPDDWKVVKLKNLIEVETGKRAKGGGLSKGNVPSIGGEHIGKDGKILWDNNLKFIPEDFYESLNQGKVRIGDILIVKDGATTGKVAIIKHLPYEKVAVNEHVFVIRVKHFNKISNEFLFYFLFSRFGQIQIKAKFHGMIGGITKNDLETIKVLLPPLPEQKAIAKILSTIHKAIQKVDVIIEKTERLKKGLMQKLLTKGIGHKEFKDTEIGRIPKEWRVVRLGELTKVTVGHVGKINEYYTTENDGVLLLSTTNISENGIRLDEIKYVSREFHSKNKKSQVFPGDIIIARHGMSGTAATIPEFLKEAQCLNVVIIRSSQKFYSKFVEYLFNFELTRRRLLGWKSGSVQGVVNTRVLEKFRIPLPPLSEQTKIASILSTVDKKLELERKRKEKLERIKKGMMNLLLTGKVRVRI